MKKYLMNHYLCVNIVDKLLGHIGEKCLMVLQNGGERKEENAFHVAGEEMLYSLFIMRNKGG